MRKKKSKFSEEQEEKLSRFLAWAYKHREKLLRKKEKV